MPPKEHGQLNALLSLLRKGNASALDEIYVTIGRRMYALARGIVGAADADDVVSESFMKIVRGIRSFREDTNGYAWVMRIVRNTAFDFLRKRKGHAEENLDAFFHLTDERYSPERRMEALALEEAIEKLSKEERKMIYYRYYLDLTVREIAAETGMSKSAVARAAQNAEEKLKILLIEGQNRSKDSCNDREHGEE